MKKILITTIAFLGLCVMSCENGKTAPSTTQNDSDTVIVDTVQNDSLEADTL